jgi:AraC-like DNA-binding protein
MALIRYRPHAPLDSCVECIWWSQRDRAEVFGEHMLPSGSVQMIFALHDAPILCMPSSSSGDALVWSGGILHGPQWTYYKSGPKPAGTTVGVSFRPGAAGNILGLPVTELTDRHVPADALWGARARELHEKLLAAQGPSAAFRVMEAELSARLHRPLLMHPAVAQALACRTGGWGPSRVAEVQRQAGYSPRHFIALFRAAVGLTPKHYYRIKRFTTALQSLASSNASGLADLAASAGYSDQAHLTREFREFSGVTPTQYRPRDPTSILHHRTYDTFSGISIGKKYSRPA